MKHSNDLNGIYRVVWQKQHYIVPMVNGKGHTKCIKLKSFTDLEDANLLSCSFNENSGPDTEYEPATEKECNWLSACIKANRIVSISETVDEFSLYIN